MELAVEQNDIDLSAGGERLDEHVDGALDEVGALMEACLARDGAADHAELDRLCAAHPEHADELRRRFGFLKLSGLDLGAAARLELPQELGDFEPLERLAAGGMGVVYRARQRSLGRDVALKLVRPELLHFPGARERFRREAAAVAQLEHPGIVPVHAAGEAGGVPYLAMQLVAGSSLAEVLAAVAGKSADALSGADVLALVRARHGGALAPLPELFRGGWTRAVVGLARQVALALAHAHARGIVHRDVKPSNVLLDGDGNARLIDFGLTSSERVDALTRTGSYVGTLHYMAPERLRGERGVDARTDVYSLGVTLYELLALALPFEAQNRMELERVVLDGRVVSLRARNRRVDADLERVCLQAMAPDPLRRYPSAQAFADDLGRWLAGEPVAARAPSGVERAARWVRRHKASAVALTLAFALVVGVPLLLFVQQHAHAGALQRSLDTERAAVRDLSVTNEIMTRVLRDASPAHSDGRAVTLVESLAKMADAAEAGDDAPRARARILSLVGQALVSRSDFVEAERLLRAADERLLAGGAADSRDRAIVLESLGRIHKLRGELVEARACYARSAEVALRAGMADESWPAEMRALEAATYFGTDNVTAARLLREAVDGFHVDPGNADDREWSKRNKLRLAQLEGAVGDVKVGLARVAEVRAELLAAGELSLRDRLELAAAESDLAMASRDFERAATVLDEALTFARSALGERNSTVATLMFQLGRAEFERGERVRARELMEAALALRAELLGADAPATAQLRKALQHYFP